MNGLVLEHQILDGMQKLYRFDNNFGASVIRHLHSYGGRDGLWELAVIYWYSDTEWHVCYATSITDDVIGYLTWDEVEQYLERIEKLEEENMYA